MMKTIQLKKNRKFKKDIKKTKYIKEQNMWFAFSLWWKYHGRAQRCF